MTVSVVSRAERLLPLLQVQRLDLSTAVGRSAERHRRVVWSALASALAKIISISTALISVPLTLHYLGAERYGMWMTMSSLVAMLSFADFGIGNGLLSFIASAHGKGDRLRMRDGISSAYVVLTLIAMMIILLFGLVYPSIQWFKIFNVNSELARVEAGPALAVFIGCFALGVPLGVVQRVQMGLQQGFTASLWQCLGSVLGLAGVLLSIRFQSGLPGLVLAFVGAPLISASINTLVFFGWTRPDLAPRIQSISLPIAASIGRTGLLFFVLQIVIAMTFASDGIVIAHMLGASAVAVYAVPEKLFSSATILLPMLLAPLWPAYGEAIARGDIDWVRKTVRRSFIIAIGFSGLCSVVLVAIGDLLIDRWVGSVIDVPMLLLLGLGIWKVLEAGGRATAVFLNGANIVKAQLIISTITAVCALSLKFLLVPLIGIAGVIWATIIAYSLFTAIPYGALISKLLARIQLQNDSNS